jgi:hypothetical protein
MSINNSLRRQAKRDDDRKDRERQMQAFTGFPSLIITDPRDPDYDPDEQHLS